MVRFFLAVALVFLLAGCVSAQGIPIPRRPDGYRIGPSSAPVILELSGDLMCPDTRTAWPALKQVIAKYTPTNQMRFVLHIFNLPYHSASFMSGMAAEVQAAYANDTSVVFKWMEAVFAEQESFGNTAIADKSNNQVLAMFGALSEKTGLAPAAVIVANATSHSNYDYNLRTSWKLNCQRGVTGTPAYFLNGAAIDASPTWTLSDWESVINPLLGISNDAVLPKDDPPVCPHGEPLCQYLPGKYECCLPGEACIPNVGCRC